MLTTFSGVLFLDYPDYKRIIHLRNFCLQNTTVFWSKWTAMYHRRPFFDILDSSRLPEIFLPIDIIKWGTHHSLAGRGVDKLVVGIVNTYMQTILSGPRFEKDQVTRQQLVFINLRADRGLFFGFSRRSRIWTSFPVLLITRAKWIFCLPNPNRGMSGWGSSFSLS